MTETLAHSIGAFWKFTLTLGCYAFSCSCALAQTRPNSGVTPVPRIGKRDTVQMRGCLGHSSSHFGFASAVRGSFILTGHTKGLGKYDNRELIIEGKMGKPIPIAGNIEPMPSFEVARIVKIFEVAHPKLNKSFISTKGWHVETINDYGLKFSHPQSMTSAEESPPSVPSEFATEEGAVMASSFNVPGDAYTNANLLGGSFTMFVNGQVSERSGCMQFAVEMGSPDGTFRAGKHRYLLVRSGSVAGGGKWFSDYYFHIFQNGQCYEFAFELAKFSAHIADSGCNIPLLSEIDDMKLIKPLLASISFSRPTARQ